MVGRSFFDRLAKAGLVQLKYGTEAAAAPNADEVFRKLRRVLLQPDCVMSWSQMDIVNTDELSLSFMSFIVAEWAAIARILFAADVA